MNPPKIPTDDPGWSDALAHIAGDGNTTPTGSVDIGVPDALLPAITASLQLADLLASPNADSADVHAYDGHVALALDPSATLDMGATLDHLTQSTDLFDVPAMDVAGAVDHTDSTADSA